MEYPQLCLRRGEEIAVRQGAAWIYDNEIDWADDICEDGGVVDVLDSRMRFVCRGFFHSRSRIAVRVLTRDPAEQIDLEFFRKRLTQAWDYRRSLGFQNSCRVIFGESDGLPGLTVDKFGDYLSYQVTSLGMELRMPQLQELLIELLRPKGICERNDLAVREKEGLPLKSGCVYGSVPARVEIREHDARMLADLLHGQKTGHFLDQQENRGRLAPYCRDRSVLDLCSHSGGFAIHAALYGAASVEAVDVSQEALELLMENAALNGVADRITPVCANVFDLVKSYAAQGRHFDVVICDPPAFAKSKKSLDAAYRGYKELNLRCMQVLSPGGILLSCSCSQFMTAPLFLQMLQEAAGDCGRNARLIETLMQSRDHPAALGAEHAFYLKGAILHIV